MLKLLAGGLYLCILTVGANIGITYWLAYDKGAKPEPVLDVLQYEKTNLIYIPILKGGKLTGYAFAQLVYTAEAPALRALSVPPGPFVVDAAFRYLYTDEAIDFAKFRKSDLGGLATAVRAAVNERFGTDVLKDVLVEQFGYRTIDQMAW